MTANERFPKAARLRTAAEFDHVYRNGRVVTDQTLVIHATTTTADTSRLGMSVSRRVGKAVVRNRWKRMIREAFRKSHRHWPDKWDLIVRPRKDAVCEYQRIHRSINKLAQRLAR